MVAPASSRAHAAQRKSSFLARLTELERLPVSKIDSFKCRKTINVGGKDYTYYSLAEAEKNGLKASPNCPTR
jgi:hypothetical protein